MILQLLEKRRKAIGAYPLTPEKINRLIEKRLVVPPFHKATTLE